MVESTVGKGEIARYEQFLLFHSVFKRLVLQTRENECLFEKGLNDLTRKAVERRKIFNSLPNDKILYYTTQNLLRITFSFNDLMLKTDRLKKDFFL